MLNELQYVLGFLFSADLKNVVLIEKQKPAWQKGFLNGIGGKVEVFDKDSYSAMKREFKEETGVEVDNWTLFATLNGEFGIVDCFYKIDEEGKLLPEVRTIEEEVITIQSVSNLYLNLIDNKAINNLRWLIALALDGNVIANIIYKNK